MNHPVACGILRYWPWTNNNWNVIPGDLEQIAVGTIYLSFPDLMIGLYQPVARIMWPLGMHKQESVSSTSLNHKLLCEKVAVTTYKWCFLCNKGFNQFVNVFRNWWPVERTKGNLRKFMYEVRTPHHKKKKGREFTKNTDCFPCCISIFPRNVLISTLVPSSLLWDLVA